MFIKGHLTANQPIPQQVVQLINALGSSERLARDVSKVGVQFGIEGEFYTQDETDTALTPVRPPSSQPSTVLDWYVSEDGKHLHHRNDADTLLHVDKWLHYLIVRVLQPNGILVTGEMAFEQQGEDVIKLTVHANKVELHV